MNTIFLKWMLVSFSLFSFSKMESSHPIFMSVTEIEQNLKNKSLEISCKIFTDDFEKTLRANYKTKVDLLDEKLKPAMDKIVNDYVQKHLKINVDGKPQILKYIGYEKNEDGINTYLEVQNITTIKKIDITDNVLYDYKSTQISLIHATIGGRRQSIKLTNPEAKAVFTF